MRLRSHHRRRRRRPSLATITIPLVFLLISSLISAKSGGNVVIKASGKELINQVLLTPSRRRLLIGPGSSPPTCRFKCGRCSPCKPVHVPIQPGLIFPLEYYPEAWRCTCGNKLFMP